jgi:hypothetical protein
MIGMDKKGLSERDICTKFITPAFARYIGIDYSGAQTPTASLRGLWVYLAEDDGLPAGACEVRPSGVGSTSDIGSRSRHS